MKKTKDLLINDDSKSMFSESIRTLRTNLAFSCVDKKMKVILVTSPESGDGKSFITANLAVAYAQAGKKVLLIDCDLRKGRQHNIFNIINKKTAGYSNLIFNYEDGIKVSDYIVKTKNDGVSLLPTGAVPPNPVELLNSANNKKILDRLKKSYDIILLDCPPVLGLADTMVMTSYSDANVVVVSSKKTKSELLERVKKAFEQANASITGVVLNKSAVKKNRYYGYYGYYGNTEKKENK